MITYEKAKASIFAVGTIPDGYTGQRALVAFSHDPDSGHTVCVAECGCFDSGIPPATDEAEALWLIEHHPSAKHIKLNRVGRCENCHDAAHLIDGLCFACRMAPAWPKI